MIKVIVIAFALSILVAENASAEIKTKSLSKKKWTLVESNNFKIITDISAKKAQLTAQQLEKYRAFCEFFLGFKPKDTGAKLVLYMTDSRRTWKAMGLSNELASVYVSRSGAPTRMFVDINGFFGNSFRKSNPGRAVVLNAVTSEIFRGAGIGAEYPLWFRTGFAYYISTYTESSNRIVLGSLEAYQNRYFSILNSAGDVSGFNTLALFARKVVSKKLAGTSTEQWLRQTNRYYMESFLTIHYLYADNERREQMVKYLNAVISGQAPDQAFRSAFTMSYTEFDKQMKRYAAGSKLLARSMDREKIQALLSLPESYAVSSIDTAEFFKYFAQGILEIGESSISSEDKQSFLKMYNETYNLNKLSAPQL